MNWEIFKRLVAWLVVSAVAIAAAHIKVGLVEG